MKVVSNICRLGWLAILAFSTAYGAETTKPKMENTSNVHPVLVDGSETYQFQHKNERGMVKVTFLIDQSGKTKDIRILNSNNNRLNTIAKRMVSKWRFDRSGTGDARSSTQLIVPIYFS